MGSEVGAALGGRPGRRAAGGGRCNRWLCLWGHTSRRTMTSLYKWLHLENKDEREETSSSLYS